MKLSNKPPLTIIILGPPGSGKGTQAGLLAEKAGFYYFETSKIGEERISRAAKGDYLLIDNKKYYFQEEKKFWQQGKLWSPPFVTALIMDKIKELAGNNENIVFSGSPRTLYEGEKILPLLKKLYGRSNIMVILLEQSAKTSIYRNSRRKICELIRHSILYSRETKHLTKCPLDGSKLIRRKALDDPKTIAVRLQEYREKTMPLIKLFKKEKIKIKKINGEQSVAAVFQSILRAIK